MQSYEVINRILLLDRDSLKQLDLTGAYPSEWLHFFCGVEPESELYGHSANSILEDVMGAQSRPEDVRELIDRFYRQLDERNLEAAEGVLKVLRIQSELMMILSSVREVLWKRSVGVLKINKERHLRNLSEPPYGQSTHITVLCPGKRKRRMHLLESKAKEALGKALATEQGHLVCIACRELVTMI